MWALRSQSSLVILISQSIFYPLILTVPSGALNDWPTLSHGCLCGQHTSCRRLSLGFGAARWLIQGEERRVEPTGLRAFLEGNGTVDHSEDSPGHFLVYRYLLGMLTGDFQTRSISAWRWPSIKPWSQQVLGFLTPIVLTDLTNTSGNSDAGNL